MEVISDPQESFSRLESDLKYLVDWAAQWRILFNALKTVYLIFSRKVVNPLIPTVHGKYPD